jgi:predicted HTH domain antitoxin
MSTVRVVEVEQDILDSARLTTSELKVEMAVHLYEQGRLSVGKARELADMTLWEFRQLLASRRIPPHYDETDLDEDVATLRELKRL